MSDMVYNMFIMMNNELNQAGRYPDSSEGESGLSRRHFLGVGVVGAAVFFAGVAGIHEVSGGVGGVNARREQAKRMDELSATLHNIIRNVRHNEATTDLSFPQQELRLWGLDMAERSRQQVKDGDMGHPDPHKRERAQLCNQVARLLSGGEGPLKLPEDSQDQTMLLLKVALLQLQLNARFIPEHTEIDTVNELVDDYLNLIKSMREQAARPPRTPEELLERAVTQLVALADKASGADQSVLYLTPASS